MKASRATAPFSPFTFCCLRRALGLRDICSKAKETIVDIDAKGKGRFTVDTDVQKGR